MLFISILVFVYLDRKKYRKENISITRKVDKKSKQSINVLILIKRPLLAISRDFHQLPLCAF